MKRIEIYQKFVLKDLLRLFQINILFYNIDMFSFNFNRERAFTLLELIVALVVLGILAAFAIPTFNHAIKSANIRSVTTSAQSLVREAKAIFAARGTGVGSIDKSSTEKAASDTPAAVPDVALPNETAFIFTSGDQTASVSVTDGSITIIPKIIQM